jgi:magnesium transporter
MISILYHENGRTEQRTTIDRDWLRPDSPGVLWVDLAAPTLEETQLLREVFGFHELAIEDALQIMHHPKIEAYDGYLYMILHGIDFHAARHQFATHDTDFFVGPRYLVTVHDGKTRSIPHVRDLCGKGYHAISEGPLALAHRIIDTMVSHYRPEVEELGEHLDRFEQRVFVRPDRDLMRAILALKRDVASLRRVVIPQRDAVGRLARREFSLVTDAIAYRFRDVYDQLVRLNDEATYFQDRISGLLDAHLASSSNRLNEVMKVLTVIATIFMPLTVLTGVYGMNVTLPALPGGPDAQFYWILGLLGLVAAVMLWFFRTRKWL